MIVLDGFLRPVASDCDRPSCVAFVCLITRSNSLFCILKNSIIRLIVFVDAGNVPAVGRSGYGRKLEGKAGPLVVAFQMLIHSVLVCDEGERGGRLTGKSARKGLSIYPQFIKAIFQKHA